MDVNGSRHHLIVGNDWQRLIDRQQPVGLAWSTSDQMLGLEERAFRFPKRPEQRLLAPADRRGAAADRYGNIYSIDQDRTAIEVATGHGQGRFWHVKDYCKPCVEGDQIDGGGDFKPAAAALPSSGFTLHGLTVTEDHYLVVGTSDPTGLLVFDLHRGGQPQWLLWPEPASFQPIDMVAAAGGGLYVLDQGSPMRIWRLDNYFRVVDYSGAFVPPEARSDFHDQDDSESSDETCHPSGLSSELALDPGLTNLVSIVALPDGSILLLESDPLLEFSWVHRFVDDQRRESFSLESILQGSLSDDSLAQRHIHGHDMAFVCDATSARESGVRGTLFIVPREGNQSFAMSLKIVTDQMSLDLEKDLYPMRRFTGTAIVDSGTDAYYDSAGRWVPLAQQRRPRFASQGHVETLILDGKTHDCVWHRLVLDACIPDGCQVTIESRVSDQQSDLKSAEWLREPNPVLRASGSEQPWQEPLPDVTVEHAGSWDLLFQSARGRYLQLRIGLHGTGRATPRIMAVRAHYPRFSYLAEYLPAVYREDQPSAGFLDRFLSNVEGMFTSLEGHIEHAQVLFDTRTAPTEYLEWLAGWLGGSFDRLWDEQRRRLFLAHAPKLFQWRGTVGGLMALIRLSIDQCPDERIFDSLTRSDGSCTKTHGPSVRIVEHFLRRIHSDVSLGDPTGSQATGPYLAADEPWQPKHGAAMLQQRYRSFLCRRYGGPPCDQPSAAENDDALQRLNDNWGRTDDQRLDIFLAAEFTTLTPSSPGQVADWQRFAQSQQLAYALVSTDDLGLYRQFLRRKYKTTDALNTAHGLNPANQWNNFDEVAMPEHLPGAGTRLADWMEFVGFVLPVKRNSHRFTVLVPTELDEVDSARRQRQRIVEEIVRREKPAHTEFDVKLFWAHFQVGRARIGIDTIVGQGSRYSALVLGADYLGRSHLAYSHPWNVKDRFVIGRQPAVITPSTDSSSTCKKTSQMH